MRQASDVEDGRLIVRNSEDGRAERLGDITLDVR